MGWWKADKTTGGISQRRDDAYGCYNGDGPADIMAKAISEIDGLYRQAWECPCSPDEMRLCFEFCYNAWPKKVHEPAPVRIKESDERPDNPVD